MIQAGKSSKLVAMSRHPLLSRAAAFFVRRGLYNHQTQRMIGTVLGTLVFAEAHDGVEVDDAASSEQAVISWFCSDAQCEPHRAGRCIARRQALEREVRSGSGAPEGRYWVGRRCPAIGEVGTGEGLPRAMVRTIAPPGREEAHLDFGVFQAIKDYDRFKRVRVAFDTIQWDGGFDTRPRIRLRQVQDDCPRVTPGSAWLPMARAWRHHPGCEKLAASPFRGLDFGVFQAIRDYDRFKRVRVAFDTIQWDGGLDLDPEFVYAKCKTIAHA